MTPSLEKVLEEIKTLTLAEQRQLRDLLDREQLPEDPSRPASLVDQIKGRYSFIETSCDAFAARKREEIDLEEQHNGKRP
jgi:hypothetical protein